MFSLQTIPILLKDAEIRMLVSNRIRYRKTVVHYSSRQQRRMKLGGMAGTACYEAPDSGGGVAPFWPWLKVGELVHLGKNTAFGLGKMTIAGISK